MNKVKGFSICCLYAVVKISTVEAVNNVACGATVPVYRIAQRPARKSALPVVLVVLRMFKNQHDPGIGTIREQSTPGELTSICWFYIAFNTL